ncbi:methylated-DNA-[protein]-cysteine S-methyltransferase [Coccidioides immitis RS]|uniref:Methylated-DNA--protein-cysteine methyltransferase n=1 Tax=Coccidioides immitis (strain RS) TaxID=246410 RepID=J3KFX0_COCIM|nr:methylated-DNA-[protein]-cysteine S-methyltransferase [Coccidioides immitis RS]EAS34562.3 methylated-DNA-[protein]-cysteine S-methyltransferase [Coccidioides immitis RS]TPX22909.1 methylated-DNA--protein-cysteine methyltransferase [Coccidioides immitis]
MGAATTTMTAARTSTRRAAKLQRRLSSEDADRKTARSQSKAISSIPNYPSAFDHEALAHSLRRIASHPTLTPYRRLVYRTLLSVPPGRWTTYATLSAHLSSSARAIGNAMKTNPFAPEVPCHRVLATDRTIGGYKGKWGNGGEYSVEKTKLLKAEGVEFDHKGKANGEVFREFADMGSVVAGQGN